MLIMEPTDCVKGMKGSCRSTQTSLPPYLAADSSANPGFRLLLKQKNLYSLAGELSPVMSVKASLFTYPFSYIACTQSKTEPIRAELSLIKAIGFMVGPDMKEVSPEEVGVLKLLKLAVEYNVFLRKLESEGRTKYTYGELIDEVILPITNL